LVCDACNYQFTTIAIFVEHASDDHKMGGLKA